MKVEVEVISSCMVKPSSPTLGHLQNYTLSFLDQINPPVFMPLVLFYPAEKSPSNTERSNQLKKSLSQAITRFYLLAGRLVGISHINCNDEGVPYFEARVNCNLSEVLNDPIPGEMNKFLPCELDGVKDVVLVIQVSFFLCGGMAVGIEISHNVADASSLFLFVTNWAAISRGNTDIPSPKFESATLFPPKDMAGFQPTTGIVKIDDIITKRFVFTTSKISALKEKYYKSHVNGENYSKPPTRIEALSAFIWTRFMTAIQAKDDPGRIYTLIHAVNLRTRADPPLPEYYFGNFSRPAITIPSLGKGDDKGDGDIVKKMRDAIHNLGGDYVSKIREGDKHLNFLKERANKFIKGEIFSFSFTSLCRFPLYEADFGWGKPAWVGSARLNFKNLVVFLDSQSGDGIEAWVNMKEEDMTKFETDKEFLSLVSLNSDAKSSIF